MAILTTTDQGLNYIGGAALIQTGATNIMQLALNGTITIDAYGGTSNVGTPTYLLGTDANGVIRKVLGAGIPGGPFLPLAGGTMTGDITLDDGSGATPSIYFKNEADNFWRYLMESGGNFSIKEGTSTRLTFQAGGNVGINVTSPSEKLEVAGNIKSTGEFQVFSGATDIGQISNNSGALNIQGTSTRDVSLGSDTSPQSIFIEGTNGDVCIGTTAPVGKLTIVAPDVTANPAISLRQTNAAAQGWDFDIENNSIGRLDISGVGAGGKVQAISILKASGNVGIGTTGPTSPLTIKSNSTSSSSSGLTIQSSGNTNDIFQLAEKSTDGARLQMLDAGVVKIALYSDGTDNYINAGNVGIGTTSPSETLEVVGFSKFQSAGGGVIFLHREDFTVSNGNQLGSVRFGGGIEGVNDYNPSAARIIGLASTHSGSYQWSSTDTASELQFGTTEAGGTTLATKMTIKHDGKVGIGTAAPTNPLDVSNAASTSIVYQRTGVSANKWGFHSDNDATYWQNVTSGSLLFTLKNGGNVGIGTTSPVNKIQANYAPVAIASLTANVGTASTNWNRNAFLMGTGASVSNALAFGVSGTANDRKTWIQAGHPDSSANSLGTISLNPLGGNVGIGTSSPKGKLHVLKGTAASYTPNSEADTLVIESATPGGISLIGTGSGGDAKTSLQFGTTSDVDMARLTYDGNNSIFTIGTTVASNNVAFTSGNSVEAMRILANGNVGIGTTGPSFKLHVDSDVASGDVCFIHHDNASQSSGTVMKIRSDAGDNAGSALLNIENNTGNALYVRGDRNVGIGVTGPSQKLHVAGNARVTGAFYDSNNSPGTAGQVLSSTATGTDWVAASSGSTVYTPDIWELANPQTISNGTVIYRSEFNGKLTTGTTGTVAEDDFKIKIVDAGVYEISYDATLQTTYSIRQVIAGYFELDDGIIAGSAMSNYLRVTGNNQGGVSSVANSFYFTATANQILQFAFQQIGPATFTGMQNITIKNAFSGMKSTVSVRRIS